MTTLLVLLFVAILVIAGLIFYLSSTLAYKSLYEDECKNRRVVQCEIDNLRKEHRTAGKRLDNYFTFCTDANHTFKIEQTSESYKVYAIGWLIDKDVDFLFTIKEFNDADMEYNRRCAEELLAILNEKN